MTVVVSNCPHECTANRLNCFMCYCSICLTEIRKPADVHASYTENDSQAIPALT